MKQESAPENESDESALLGSRSYISKKYQFQSNQ